MELVMENHTVRTITHSFSSRCMDALYYRLSNEFFINVMKYHYGLESVCLGIGNLLCISTCMGTPIRISYRVLYSNMHSHLV
jgi:hypothetical protein